MSDEPGSVGHGSLNRLGLSVVSKVMAPRGEGTLSAELLGLFGIFTAVAALLATLWQGYLLRRQLYHFDRVSRAQFYQQVTMMCIQRDQIFIEHPDLWSYFYDGREVPRSKAQRARVSAMYYICLFAVSNRLIVLQ